MPTACRFRQPSPTAFERVGRRWGSRRLGLFQSQAELRLQSIMGLQTYNSLRVLDWFSELPCFTWLHWSHRSQRRRHANDFAGRDPTRWPAVFFPALMVSTAMQGGCTCENCNYLWIGSGNIEFAAMAAPLTVGHDSRRRLDEGTRCQGLSRTQAGIAPPFNAEKSVMAKDAVTVSPQFQLRESGGHVPLDERSFEARVGEPHRRRRFQAAVDRGNVGLGQGPSAWPMGGDDFERSLLHRIAADSDKQLAALQPKEEKLTIEFLFRCVVEGLLQL